MNTSVSASSSLPRTEYRNIKDEAAVSLTTPAEAVPIRLPFFASYAPWGETDRARYVDASAVAQLYGAEILNPKSPFFTHQSQFLRSQLTAGGKALFLGLRAPDARQANFRLALEFVADDVPLYERALDGSIVLDASGQRKATGATTKGYRAQWRKMPISAVSDQDATLSFGSGPKGKGISVIAKDGTVSDMLPILDGLARFSGSKGSNFGFRLIAPTVNSVDPANEELQEELQSFIYRMQIVRRASSKSTAQVVRTLGGDGFTDFTFKKGTIDLDTEIEYHVDKKILPSYESRDESAFTGFGPFEKLHVYQNNIAEVLKLFAEAEAAYTGEELSDINLFNFLTGVDINGNPYNTFVVEGPDKGGLLFGELSNHYMVGGSDGTLGIESFNKSFEDMLDSVGNNQIPFMNIARMPYDSVWDSGFPTDIKKKFSVFLQRPDVYVHLCTQDVSKPINTPSIDSSVAVTLRSHYRSIAESAEFGTKACRAAIFSNAGYLINDNYDGLVPFLEFILILGARYMGAENGEMNNTYSFGRGEQNVVTRYRDHNATTRENTVRNVDWNNGMNYAEYYDMSRLFYAGMQSIYEDHTSVLHSYLNVQIACNLTRIGNIVWRELSGDSQLTDDQFLDRVVEKVTAKTTGKYDGRVDVTPRAYYNALDENLGFSWHLDIDMAGDNIRTVEHLAIIAQRRRNEEVA